MAVWPVETDSIKQGNLNRGIHEPQNQIVSQRDVDDALL